MHHVEIAYVSYFNDELLAVNSLELVYRYKKASTVLSMLVFSIRPLSAAEHSKDEENCYGI